MTVCTFDSLAYSKRLQKAGIPAEQADTFAELAKQYDDLVAARVIKEAATKGDIAEVRLEMKAMEMRLLKWQLGVGIATVLTLAGIMAKGFGWLGF